MRSTQPAFLTMVKQTILGRATHQGAVHPYFVAVKVNLRRSSTDILPVSVCPKLPHTRPPESAGQFPVRVIRHNHPPCSNPHFVILFAFGVSIITGVVPTRVSCARPETVHVRHHHIQQHQSGRPRAPPSIACSLFASNLKAVVQGQLNFNQTFSSSTTIRSFCRRIHFFQFVRKYSHNAGCYPCHRLDSCQSGFSRSKAQVALFQCLKEVPAPTPTAHPNIKKGAGQVHPLSQVNPESIALPQSPKSWLRAGFFLLLPRISAQVPPGAARRYGPWSGFAFARRIDIAVANAPKQLAFNTSAAEGGAPRRPGRLRADPAARSNTS